MEAILLKQQQQQMANTNTSISNTPTDNGNLTSMLTANSDGTATLETTIENALHHLCAALTELQVHLRIVHDDNDDDDDDDGDDEEDSNDAVTNGHHAVATGSTNDNDDDDATATIDELLQLCASIQPDATTATDTTVYLQPIQLVRAIVDAAALSTEAQQQAALFDALGSESEDAMRVLFTVATKLSYIQQHIHPHDIDQYVATNRDYLNNSNGDDRSYTDNNTPYYEESTMVDIDEERRQLLLQEAMDAAQIAAIAQAQIGYGGSSNGAGAGTHTVVRTSDRQAVKFAEKAKKRAATALQRAKDAGVTLLDESDLLAVHMQQNMIGDGGLMNRTEQEIWELQQSLLPTGTREYYDHRGLPKDAIREMIGRDMERVMIPAKLRDERTLPPRLLIRDCMDPVLGQAFDGTSSLNPMQSSTFPIAFHARDNMMICAPTGAGKTNVAMLAVVAHFRDVGLIRGNDNSKNTASDILETGKKVVYIAPMKALAQEVVEKFSSKLKSLRLIVRELTGDMQLTRSEAEAANVIVTTPEKWDVVTRKSGTDENALGNQCGLLIIDEVHLLADERGAVIESVVARLHRLVESRQRQVRIVALSATLPNYDDVANFLQVPERGIFYFGPEHRPVPLQQTFIGLTVNNKNRALKEKRMNEVCFDIVLDSLQRGYQVMVFVHSRKGTGDTAKALADIATLEGVLEKNFVTAGKEGPNGDAFKRYVERVKKSRNRELASHFESGCGIHHAGMLRGDRKLTEQMFSDGAIKVLCCTATLAWGINLPAHTVVVKGTEVYNPEKGGIVDLSILDVQQIFGRAGRPQFDSSGEANLITTSDAFPRYMDKLVRPVPIESNFIKQLADHLNAEVVSGTVTNISEASTWLTYTYLYVRMLRNPHAYGISQDQKADDPNLRQRCISLVTEAAKLLDSNKMLRFDPGSGNLGVAHNGRVAAHFYIQAESVATFLEMFGQISTPSDSDLCHIICSATEFRNMKLRQEEMDELQQIAAKACPFRIKGAGTDDQGRNLITDPIDKAYVLLQAYISRAVIKSFTLISDMNYIASNAGRVARALFEMCLQEKKATEASKLLRIANSVDKQIWWFKTPLRNFESELKESVYSGVESFFGSSRHHTNSYEDILSLLEMQPEEVGQLCKSNKAFGSKIQRFVRVLPNMWISCIVKPITSTVLRFRVQLDADFEWDGRWHGGAQNFWMCVEDRDSNKIHHQEQVILSKRTYKDAVVLEFMVPIFTSVPEQYYIRLCADGWVGVENVFPVPLRDIEIPTESAPYTDLLDLTPLPTTALNNPSYEQLYTKFQTFNPIQTHLFHVLYHTDSPVLLGAPTGSGKTLVAELAILRLKHMQPKCICVYIAPLKALAGERMKDWRKRFGSPPLSWNVLELSGDTHHDQTTLERADILVCTPEKWDLVSRGWRGVRDSGDNDSKIREYISRVGLLIMDEVHLLGEERGAVLEAIVSRTRFISRHVESNASENVVVQPPTRIIGLSTALANPVDLADWIGINTSRHGPTYMRGLYNFRPSVRPVPTKIHLQGFPGKHYCPRMATMNKPCFAAIKELSPVKPTLIFVASRRQTRLTAFDIISYAASDERPKMFLECDDTYVEAIAEKINDEALRHTITFGIGLHHAGLSSYDRDVVERMFLGGEIKVLVATATLAWGVNLPAHLVIVKGTEYFDGKSSRYVDYPLTDVLQMIGRAGRPGFDTHADAVVMVRAEMKEYYKRFLYSAFPVESCLEQRIHENLNAEIASGTIHTISDCVGYLTWTYFARRVKKNPMYYGAESSTPEHVEARLLDFVKESIDTLKSEGCVELLGLDESSEIHPTTLGIAASQYYLSHRTPKQMQVGIREGRKILMKSIRNSDDDTTALTPTRTVGVAQSYTRSSNVDESSIAWLLFALCSTHEFDELPVRHNEEHLNEDLSKDVMWGPDVMDVLSGNHKKGSQRQYRNVEIYLDPHTKAFLLVQAHLEYTKLPISDYVNDTKSVMENLPRILAAMSYIATNAECNVEGSFEWLTQFSRTRQLLSARCTVSDDPLQQLPGFNPNIVQRLQSGAHVGAKTLLDFRLLQRKDADQQIQKVLQGGSRHRKDDVVSALYAYPLVTLTEAIVKFEVDKGTDKCIGKLSVKIDVERSRSPYKNNNNNNNTNGSKYTDNSSYTLTILLGSYNQRSLLSSCSIRLSRSGTWTITKELSFDWDRAKNDGDDCGDNKNKVIVRLLLDEVRGLDFETVICI